MENPLTKTIAGLVLVAASSLGTYTITEKQVSDLEAEIATKTIEVNIAKESKILSGKDYIYSQITSGHVPNFTGALSSDEIGEAYVKAYEANGGDLKAIEEKIKSGGTVNLMTEIELLAETKREMLKCVR